LAYTAGLLHDIGKIVLSDFFENEEFAAKVEDGAMDNDDFLGSEERLFGINHAQVGARIAESWNLPQPLQVAILHHHQPSAAPDEFQELCLAVHLGDVFSMLAGVGAGMDSSRYTLDPMVDRFIRRDADWELKSFPKLLGDIETEFREALSLSDADASRV